MAESFDPFPRNDLPSPNPAISEGPTLAEHGRNLSDLAASLHEAVQHSPDKGTIYLAADGSQTFQSYPELLTEARRIQSGLRAYGLMPQDKVLFQFEDNRDFIAGFWGCVLGGCIPIPLSVPASYDRSDSALSKLQSAHAMFDKPRLMTSARLTSTIRAVAPQLGFGADSILDIELLRTYAPAAAPHENIPDDLALLLLTSGSTGQPKGVALTHRNLLARSAGTAQMNAFTPADISLNWMPLDHVGGIVMYHVQGVFDRCTQIHAPTEAVLRRPFQWLDWIHQFRVTSTWAPNFAFGLINDHAAELAGQRWDLSCLRFILNAGEAIVSKTARSFLELLAPFGLPATAMHPAWGMSETSSGVTFSDRFMLSTTNDADSFVEVGMPIPGAAVRIVNARNELLHEEEIGRLQVRGLPVTAAYYNNPKLNAEVFTADGWFNTGDLGRLRAGCLTITGREKDVIIVNGINFYSHEIESVAEEITGVEVSFTAACPVRLADEDTDRVAIFFHPSEGADRTELLRTIRARILQKIGLNPDYLVALPKEAIPKTAIGKIQRSQLRKRFEDGEFDGLREPKVTAGIPDWFYARRWRPEPLAERITMPSETTVIFEDSEGLADRLAEKLEARRIVWVERGERFEKLGPERFRIAPANCDDYRRLFAEMGGESAAVQTLVHLWTYTADGPEPASVEALAHAQESAAFSLLFVLQELVPWPTDRKIALIVASTGCQAAAADDRVAYEKTPLLGLVRTVPHEFESTSVQHVDFAKAEPERDAAHLAQEINAPPTAIEVAYRGDSRLVPVLEKVSIESVALGPRAIKPAGMYLITGGLGGIGSHLAEYLLRNFRARLLLIGRSTLPPESEWPQVLGRGGPPADRVALITKLRKLGGQVVYESADVSDERQIRSAHARACATWQCNLDGIFHLAGKYQQRSLAFETPETLTESLRPKVYGAWCLHRIAIECPGILFVNFSSSISHVSGYLIGAYTAANSFLDGLSHFQRTQCSIRSHSLLWSLWRGIGMGVGFKGADTIGASGFLEIGAKEGIESLAFALRSGEPELLIGIAPTRSNEFRRDIQPDAQRAAELEADRLPPRTGTEEQMMNIWQDLLKRSPIGVRDSFFEMGGNSLLAARLFARIERTFSHSLPIATLFRAPTIEQLAAILDTQGQSGICNLIPLERRGSQPPLFCIPGGGSDAIVFRDLSHFLGSEQPFYGLQARGLDATKTEGHLSVEETAQAFIQKIRSIQPSGPYFLGGHCFGCVLAFEMAQQLRNAGEEVPVLALLDPIVSDSLSMEIIGTDRLIYHFRKFMKLPLGEKWKYFATRVRNFSRTLIVRRRIRGSYEQAEAMHRDYQLKPYPGQFACFIATDSFHGMNPQRDPRRAWGRLGNAVEYIEVDGDHHTMLHDPAVKELANNLRAYISRAKAPTGAGKISS